MTNLDKLFEQAAKVAVGPLPKLGFDSPEYRARLKNWHQQAGVGRWTRDEYRAEPNSLPFSPELVPLAQHSLVCERGDAVRNQVLGQHLYRFCSFTEHLELEAVVPACTRLRLRNVPFFVPEPLARDAGRVVIDEAWHAECAVDLKLEIAREIGITPCRPRTPAFLHVLGLLKNSLSARQQSLADMAFTCVSETLITGSLTQVPQDTRVASCIRSVLKEHAREEAFHHSIFGQVIGLMWDQLPVDDRDIVGPLFSASIAIFLRADTIAELDGLEASGFTAWDARQIVEESYERELGRSLWKAASPTIRFMQQHGMLDNNATFDSLASMNLLPPAAQ